MKPCPLHIKCECCFAQFYTSTKWHFTYVLLFFILILAAFPAEMCVWAPLKWQDTLKLQRSAALMLGAAQGLADSAIHVFVSSAESLLSVSFASLCTFRFVSLPAFFRTRAWTCIYVLPKCRWIILSFSRVAVWGSLCVMSMRWGLYEIEESLWTPNPPPPYGAEQLWCLSVHTSIHFNCQESWLMDSHYYLLHGLSVGLNTLICNKVWDHTDPWPWDWPHKAENMWP